MFVHICVARPRLCSSRSRSSRCSVDAHAQRPRPLSSSFRPNGPALKHPLRNVVCRAAVAEEPALLDHSKIFRYGKGEFEIEIAVNEDSSGNQRVQLETTHPSANLILHWGVQGGKNYQGGWRLPDIRPPNTVQYKERALQTAWQPRGDGKQTIEIALEGDEASDYINFVLKDAATNTWYDSNGSNFQMALHASLRSFASIDDAEEGASIFSLEEIPDVPSNMAGIWAYIMWEAAGCPNRSQEAADREYKAGIAELQTCLCRGKTLDELWQVANGDIKYMDFKREFLDAGAASARREERRVVAAAAAAAAAAASAAAVESPPKVEKERKQVVTKEAFVPDDLIGIKAYIMWEKAGQPDGADFSQAARQAIANELTAGSTIEEIEAKLRAPPKEAPSKPKDKAAPAPGKAPEKVVLGDALDVPKRDPLMFIKSDEVPVLSYEKTVIKEKPMEFLVQAAALDEETRFRRLFRLGDGSELLAVVQQRRSNDNWDDDSDISVTLTTDEANGVVLHWGVGTQHNKSWSLPADNILPPNSEKDSGGIAVDTPFTSSTASGASEELRDSRVPLQQVRLTIPKHAGVASVQFVLRSSDRSMWYRDGNSNFSVPLAQRGAGDDGVPQVEDSLMRSIVDAENTSAWTLMHRCNRAADLLGDVLGGSYDDKPAAMAFIYTWLRYSATRNLTWQRNYNTQPRILSSAQSRLTEAIADAHRRTQGEAQEWVRLMLSCIGRGGNGQAIRDEILNIMHRNHIKEVKGTWMEEWHQKLHNNTTPDDVPICEAYIAFLRSNGDNSTYWRVLSDAGISRARLEGFDRAIRCEPEYFADKRGALIGEFENYLAILKAVHSGADLQNAAKHASGQLPGAAKGHLGYVLASQGSNQVLPLMQSAVACRLELHSAMTGNRDLLYLDLALEDVVRSATERGVSDLDIGAAAFVGPLLQNLVLTAGNNEELCYCLKAWQALPRSIQYGSTPSTVEALQATAIVDRVRRAVSELSDAVVNRVQPPATIIGKNCGVEDWAVDVFAEEVVRGGPAFAVSLVLSTVEPALRRCAALGAWQIISPANVVGRVLEVPALTDVQDKVYSEPMILVAQRVSGEEEIPEGAVAVVTPDAPDILSHSAVRARNMKVLFATCHDAGPLDDMRACAGQLLEVETSAAGNVTWKPAEEGSQNGDGSNNAGRKQLKISVPKWCGKWAVNMSEYGDGVVGAKSKNLAALRGELPDWIALPSSVTLPFGCFEEVLNARVNSDVKKRVLAAAKEVPASPASNLLTCRDAVLEMKLPAELKQQLEAKMSEAGIPLPEGEARWAAAEKALLGVWASKFNDRAYFSMRKVGLDFMDLRMAVLVQRVVPARYAFVIHTNNPSTGNTEEIYCELVKGLGESLVSGTVPGSALSFSAPKSDLENPVIVTFPSKSNGMFVPESLIFRSDSNGEDLAGYAGAGLYESLTMDSTTLERVDFSGDPVMEDEHFRQDLLSRICKVGAAIEESMGSAQDIEGVVDPDGNITVVQTRPQV